MKLKYLFLAIAVAVMSASCGEMTQLLKSNDSEKIYKVAKGLYNIEEYNKALKLLEKIRNSFIGTEKGEDIVWMLADINYKKKNYLIAAEYYSRVVKTYPKSARVEESLLKEGECYFLDSPSYNLDQSKTYQGIDKLQEFVDKYPNSKLLPQANNMILELLNKLQRKSFEVAKGYYKIRDYQAAIKTLDNFLIDNPGSPFKEEASYLRLSAGYMLADNSVKSKEKQRFEETIQTYKSFVSNFPESTFKKQAEEIYKKATEKIKTLENEQTEKQK